jgi:hypothetical protein
LLCGFAFGQVVSASPEPNFNGTWVLDQVNGKPLPSEVIRFSLTLKGNEFVVEFPGSPNKQEYVLDGTERILPAPGARRGTMQFRLSELLGNNPELMLECPTERTHNRNEHRAISDRKLN